MLKLLEKVCYPFIPNEIREISICSYMWRYIVTQKKLEKLVFAVARGGVQLENTCGKKKGLIACLTSYVYFSFQVGHLCFKSFKLVQNVTHVGIS